MRRAWVAAALAVVLGTAGCGGGTLPEAKVGGAGFGATAHGTVVMWCRAATQTASQLVVDRFNASHKNLKVQLTAIPDAQYITKLATAIRARVVPDLVDIDDINTTLLASHQALTDLTPLISALPYKDKLSPGHLNLGTLGGKHYGLPFAADVSVLFYNKALFTKAGLDPNKGPTSLREVLTDARKINALGGGVKGYSFGGNSPGIMGFTALPNVWATKTHLFQGPVGSQTVRVAGNEPLRQVLQFYRTVWAEKLAPVGDRTESGATWGADFKAGTVGIWPGNWGVMVSAPKKFLSQVGAVALPGPTGGGSVFSGGDNIAIVRGAKNPAGAWQVAKFALAIEQQKVLPSSGYTPVRSDINTPEFRRTWRLDAVAVAELKRGYAEKTLAYNTTFNQVSGPWFAMFIRAVFHGDVDGALRAAQPGFSRTLDQAQT